MASARFTETNGIVAALFSIPFMMIGLGAIGGGAYAVVINHVSPVVLTILAPFGLVFFCVGAAVGFVRHTLEIDGDRKTFVRSWGVFFTFKRTEEPLGQWQHVGIARERR